MKPYVIGYIVLGVVAVIAVVIAATFLFATVGGLVLHYLAERPIVAWSQRWLFPKRIEGR